MTGWVAIFFFKPKTAYEMRISDWSSDVCSSDLHAHSALHTSQVATRNHGWWLVVDADLETGRAPVHELDGALGLDGGNSSVDRKSVVSGKSVSVRVDLGGRRVIKKKKNLIYTLDIQSCCTIFFQ